MELLEFIVSVFVSMIIKNLCCKLYFSFHIKGCILPVCILS